MTEACRRAYPRPVQFVQLEGAARPSPHVLLVEDEAGIRQPLGRFLRAQGCEVTEAADGTEAVMALRTREFDAIISDIRMPGGTGLAVWEVVVAERPRLTRRFVFISAFAPPGEVIAAGARYVVKPFDLAVLWREVEAALGGE